MFASAAVPSRAGAAGPSVNDDSPGDGTAPSADTLKAMFEALSDTFMRKLEEDGDLPMQATDADATSSNLARRMATASESGVIAPLLAIGEIAETAKQERKQGFTESEKELDFDKTQQQALVETTSVMSRMLALVALLGGIAVFAVYSVTYFTGTRVEGEELTDATAADLELDAVSRKESEERVKIYVTAMTCIGFAGALVWGLVGLEVPPKHAFYSIPPLILAGLFPKIYYLLGGEDLNSLATVSVICIAFAISGAPVPEIMYSFRREYGEDLAGSGARQRQAEIGGLVQLQTIVKTKRQRIRRAVAAMLPALVTLLTIVFYSIVIFGMNDAMDHNAWKVSVALLALVVKVAGNKLQLKLIDKANVATWVADLMLFFYEFSTALLCRLLQLSIPSENAAKLMSLFSAIAEMAVRVYFYNLYIKAWCSKKGKMNKKELLAYQKRGKLRVQDGERHGGGVPFEPLRRGDACLSQLDWLLKLHERRSGGVSSVEDLRVPADPRAVPRFLRDVHGDQRGVE